MKRIFAGKLELQLELWRPMIPPRMAACNNFHRIPPHRERPPRSDNRRYLLFYLQAIDLVDSDPSAIVLPSLIRLGQRPDGRLFCAMRARPVPGAAPWMPPSLGCISGSGAVGISVRESGLGQKRTKDLAAIDCRPFVPAVVEKSQLPVVQTEAAQDGGVDIVHVSAVLDSV